MELNTLKPIAKNDLDKLIEKLNNEKYVVFGCSESILKVKSELENYDCISRFQESRMFEKDKVFLIKEKELNMK